MVKFCPIDYYSDPTGNEPVRMFGIASVRTTNAVQNLHHLPFAIFRTFSYPSATVLNFYRGRWFHGQNFVQVNQCKPR